MCGKLGIGTILRVNKHEIDPLLVLVLVSGHTDLFSYRGKNNDEFIHAFGMIIYANLRISCKHHLACVKACVTVRSK